MVSRPAPDRAVIDAGSKVFVYDPSIHPEVPAHGYVLGWATGSGLILERLSEEHGVIHIKDPTSPLRVGDRLAIVPPHGGSAGGAGITARPGTQP